MCLIYLVTGDDAESVCSCTEREGDAFPKAFERELVTPTNLDDSEHDLRALEERRKSLLDHHWAIPSRDRQYVKYGINIFKCIDYAFILQVCRYR